MVVAFVGTPHRINDRGSQVLKALREIGFDQYYQAEQTGWVLYLEGSTDLAIMQAFARRLGHERAIQVLERPFVKYVGNHPPAVQNHYHGLREALPTLGGVVLFDRLESEPLDISPVECLIWKRREIENYVCSRATLEEYASASASASEDAASGPLFAAAEVEKRQHAMGPSHRGSRVGPKDAWYKGSPWSADIKASDDFLVPLFEAYFGKLGLPNLMAKKNFYELAEHVPDSEIDPEISEKLDAIVRVAESATPAGD